MRFKQAIQIGSHIDDIFKLPCVFCARKGSSYARDGIEYSLVENTISERYKLGDKIIAYQGDWLCEDYDGQWHLLSDEEYKMYLRHH